MKRIVTIWFMLLMQFGFAADLFSVKLSENQKLESTYSMILKNDKSAHFLMIKNTDSKNFVTRIFVVDENKKTKELEAIQTKEEPNIISSRFANNTISFINYSSKNKTATFVDIDLTTGKNLSNTLENIDEPEIILNDEYKSVLINILKNSSELEILVSENANQVQSHSLNNISKEIFADFKSVLKNNPDAINQNEFVKNGSIKNERVYLNNNLLYFTKDTNKDETQVFTIDLKKPNYVDSAYYYLDLNNTNLDKNSYVFQNTLIMSGTEKDNVVLKLYDLDKKNLLKQIALNQEIFKNLSPEAVKQFLAEGKKSSLKLTTSLNKTKANTYQVTLDRVQKNTYNYYYNWWWHHQFMMMQQQQQMQMMRNSMPTAPRGFGPSNNFLDYENFIEEDSYQSLIFELNSDFTYINTKSEPVYNTTNKKEFIKDLEENKNMKKVSTSFLDSEVHCVYQDKNTKQIIIDSKPLH